MANEAIIFVRVNDMENLVTLSQATVAVPVGAATAEQLAGRIAALLQEADSGTN